MTDDKIFINDICKLADNSKFRSAMPLLNVYVKKRDNLNRIENVSKETLAYVLEVTRRTISNWIRILVRCGAIKYQYSGSTRLNPDFYYSGTKSDYARALREWERFQNSKKLRKIS